MRLSIHFNWPPATSSARISFGLPNVEDENYSFNVGVIEASNPNIVKWLKSEHINSVGVNKMEFDVGRDSKIVVQKLDKNTKAPLGEHIWDVDHYWPPQAVGGTSTEIPWDF